MKSRITKTVALAALMAGASGVAQATEGWYGRADAGYSLEGETNFGSAAANQFGLEDDWMQSAGLGYAFDNNFRLEGEISHRFNALDPLVVGREDGDVRAFAAMLNGYYDFNRGGRFEPYVGLGIGGARVDGNFIRHTGLVNVDDKDTGIAYQALAGVAIGLTEQLDLDIGYRYFTVQNLEFDGTTSNTTPTTFDSDYEHQAVTVGLRWQFAGAAPPPPPVVVTPPPTPPPPPPPRCWRWKPS